MSFALQYLVLADDLTGSLEAGALYAKSGTSCAVTIANSVPDEMSVEALVMDVEARHANPERAAGIGANVVSGARAYGISRIYLKVDSTLRGSIPAQIRGALAGWLGRPVVFAPAYPRMGRAVRAGRLYVNGQLLTDSVFAHDPMDPAQTSSVSERLLAGGCGPVRHVADAAELRDALSSPLVSSVLICDAENAEQMRQLAHAVVASGWLPICAGSAGFLAELIAAENEVYAKSGLIINGSLNSTSLKQCELASSDVPVYTVGCNDDVQALASEVTRAVHAEGWAILSTNTDKSDSSCVLERLATVASIVLRDTACYSLTIFGGDTAAKILSTLGVHVIHPIRELLPGIPVSRITVERRPLKLVTKAGGFGEPDVIRQIRAALRSPE